MTDAEHHNRQLELERQLETIIEELGVAPVLYKIGEHFENELANRTCELENRIEELEEVAPFPTPTKTYNENNLLNRVNLLDISLNDTLKKLTPFMKLMGLSPFNRLTDIGHVLEELEESEESEESEEDSGLTCSGPKEN